MFRLPQNCHYIRLNGDIVTLHRHQYITTPLSDLKYAFYLSASCNISGLQLICMYLLANYIWIGSAPSKLKALAKTVLTALVAISSLALIIGALLGLIKFYVISPAATQCILRTILGILLLILCLFILIHIFCEFFIC